MVKSGKSFALIEVTDKNLSEEDKLERIYTNPKDRYSFIGFTIATGLSFGYLVLGDGNFNIPVGTSMVFTFPGFVLYGYELTEKWLYNLSVDKFNEDKFEP